MATVEHCLYCFEVLSASLEKRTPMTLSQVQTSWAEYPKGLEEDSVSIASESEEPSTSIHAAPRNPTLQRVSESGRSTPGSSSSGGSGSGASSLRQESDVTTPSSNGSTPSFVPVGMQTRGSKQRSTITESPLFVTWNTVSPTSHSRHLRGCIGTFETQPLSTGLSSYALHSALQDHRFSPITKGELPSLEVSVTLLTDFETCKGALDWELGVHGIRISFYAKNRRFGACYLPDVAVEQGWDKEETMVSLMRKAGWGGKKEKWAEVGDMTVTRFQGAAESVGWEEFKAWKTWVGKK
ncbi:Uncharacterized protein LHYA1_G000828 [Lachnellula hyalina]|uniref:AMMECR1 domain-containing protein n=1 Tax=Lachnellula hyalina TaxID=1316788 RepID=A0A8H8U560_9HELO|nr:Uncharacterized protein LHYA1_G000828 [Lachnellula hyalina]TVY30899.1 Uncharacterized protein LHYA1_G000828 [Lachnellula hyalina]